VQDRRSTERGFSLTELLTVVAIIGVITLVTVPAMIQLMPQYRIRSAASDAGASLRMIRQKAITTRTPWKISFDAANDRYAYYRLNAPNATRSDVGNWINMGRDTRANPTSGSVQWIRASAIDLQTSTTNPNPFKNIDCDANSTVDIVFLRDGSIANDPNGGTCGAGANLLFTTQPSILFAVDNRFVKYNRYYLALSQNGTLTIRPAKE
jgi:prepilin-type N-terminal cleavage/methylation domain-containing protein